MIIPKKNRHEICKYLFQEGVLYAKKDYNLAKHPEIDVPNLQVIKLMQSFKSREYVRETFAWQHYYWYLTNDGIEYLRTEKAVKPDSGRGEKEEAAEVEEESGGGFYSKIWRRREEPGPTGNRGKGGMAATVGDGKKMLVALGEARRGRRHGSLTKTNEKRDWHWDLERGGGQLQRR